LRYADSDVAADSGRVQPLGFLMSMLISAIASLGRTGCGSWPQLKCR
jgi:hypothetical protein